MKTMAETAKQKGAALSPSGNVVGGHRQPLQPLKDGMLVVERRVPESAFQAAKLCLAPTGEGWGIPLGKSVTSGCVPLMACAPLRRTSSRASPTPSFTRPARA